MYPRRPCRAVSLYPRRLASPTLTGKMSALQAIYLLVLRLRYWRKNASVRSQATRAASAL
jgi:hypothetical protein